MRPRTISHQRRTQNEPSLPPSMHIIPFAECCRFHYDLGMEMISKGRVRLTCAHCSKPFETYLSHAKRRAQTTCSLSCARRHWPNRKSERVHVSCENCSTLFEVSKHRAFGIGRPKARFCSDKCKNEAQKGAGHPAYIDGRAEARMLCRKVIGQRIAEEGCCQECGATDFLHGHHIKSFAEYPDLRMDPDNIQVLCRSCHADKHPHQARKLFKGVARSGETKTCPQCEKQFYVKKSHAAARITCSVECSIAFRTSRPSGFRTR